MNIGITNSVASSIQNTTGVKKDVKPEVSKVVSEEAAVYEKTETVNNKIYNKNSTERAAIVEQLKAAQEQREKQFMELVQKTITKQAGVLSFANGDDIWKILASGNFEVDPEIQAQAKEDIAEDGYWGVEQTAGRIFDFASALAGDDEKLMKKMQAAFEKGFKQATGAWGKELPDISHKTYDAVTKKFDEYYASKKSAE